VRAAAGRGFRTPTVAEKTDPAIGNPSLSPEVTTAYEAGADAVLAGGEALVSATWFYQSFRDLIQFDGTVPGPVGFGELRNSGRARSRGVEASATWNFFRTAAAEITYTYTDTWDSSTQRRILGHPLHRGSASLVLKPVPGLTLRADWLVESDMLDAPPNGEDPHRPGYARVDLYGRYVWKTGNPSAPEVALHGKIRNLTDLRYEERVGFPAPGINFLFGMEMAI
jgi:vitamin B12 transporter